MNFRKRLISLMITFASLLAGCKEYGITYPKDTSKQVTITQGAWGNVWFWEGNFQPLEYGGTITPVERQILIYEATPPDSATGPGGGFWRDIRTKLVATTGSNKTGFFQITLPPGAYSAFVKEDSLYFSSYETSFGIGGFKVFSDAVTKVQLDITYNAAY